MRLHQMIEIIERAERAGIVRPSAKMKEQVPGKTSSEILREWCDKPTFEFGDVGVVDTSVGTSLVGYANELARNGMFHLPFEKMVISFNARNVAHVTICAEEHDGIIFLSIFTVDSQKKFASHGKVCMRSDDNGILMQVVSCKVPGGYTDKVKGQIVNYTENIFPTWVIGLMAMLEAKGVEQRLTPAPKKLNKRRTAAGKPPIGEVREIFIRVGGVSYRTSGEAEIGSHRSPRLHWRRGHVRRLPSGELTHVRPCLVGERVGGEEPPAKTYRVLA